MKYAGGHGGRGQLLGRRREEASRGEDAKPRVSGGWIGAKEMRPEASTGGRGLPRIISFNYSKMSGWITSYFFLELTFNGLSALPATTDSFYILPLVKRKERERERGRVRACVPNIVVDIVVVVGLHGRPIKID